MNEQWIKWKPASRLAKSYYLDSISDEIDGFVIVLSEANDEKNKIRLTYDESVEAYRRTDESFRRNQMYILSETMGQEFWADWTFFKVMNSNYIVWLEQESHGIIESLSLTHYSIITTDSIIDIATNYEPKVEFVTDK